MHSHHGQEVILKDTKEICIKTTTNIYYLIIFWAIWHIFVSMVTIWISLKCRLNKMPFLSDNLIVYDMYSELCLLWRKHETWHTSGIGHKEQF